MDVNILHNQNLFITLQCIYCLAKLRVEKRQILSVLRSFLLLPHTF